MLVSLIRRKEITLFDAKMGADHGGQHGQDGLVGAGGLAANYQGTVHVITPSMKPTHSLLLGKLMTFEWLRRH